MNTALGCRYNSTSRSERLDKGLGMARTSGVLRTASILYDRIPTFKYMYQENYRNETNSVILIILQPTNDCKSYELTFCPGASSVTALFGINLHTPSEYLLRY